MAAASVHPQRIVERLDRLLQCVERMAGSQDEHSGITNLQQYGDSPRILQSETTNVFMRSNIDAEEWLEVRRAGVRSDDECSQVTTLCARLHELCNSGEARRLTLGIGILRSQRSNVNHPLLEIEMSLSMEGCRFVLRPVNGFVRLWDLAPAFPDAATAVTLRERIDAAFHSHMRTLKQALTPFHPETYVPFLKQVGFLLESTFLDLRRDASAATIFEAPLPPKLEIFDTWVRLPHHFVSLAIGWCQQSPEQVIYRQNTRTGARTPVAQDTRAMREGLCTSQLPGFVVRLVGGGGSAPQSSGGASDDVLLPFAYNPDQLSIVHGLMRGETMVVQGPPGR